MVNLRSLLSDHEAATVQKIAQLRAELVPLERELFEIRLAKSALARGPAPVDQPQLALLKSNEDRGPENHIDAWRNIVVHGGHRTKSPYERLTIKELVKKALIEQFKDGATAHQLLELFANAWGRHDVMRTSLSPQLSRLRNEGVVFRKGQVWRLAASHNPEAKKAATDP